MTNNNQSKMIIDLFEECTQQYPSNLALILEDNISLTYSNLSKLSSKIQQLVYQIVKKTKNNDDSSTPLIAVMTDRNISFIVSMLGILSAGAAYVPVDPSFPPDRQVHIFNHSQCEFLIIDDTSFDAAVSLGVTLPPLIKMDSNGNILEITIPGVSLDGFHDPEEIIEYRKTNGSERLAYVLYTSGSTGKPKGVMVKNIGVVNIVSWFADQIGITSTTRVMGLTTFCFDISVLEMCMPLIRGGALVLGKTASQKDPFTLLEVIKRLNITVFQATPTTYEMMMATGWKGDSSIDFLVGGEAFRPTLLPLASTCRSLRNVYGPTESTIWSTSYTVTQSWVEQQLSKTNTSVAVPIGDAISETSLYLVTEQQPYKEVGYYEEGELWIGGVGVATGYLHAPDLTEQRFLKNPFGEGFVYRTGDVVKRLQDGTNQYIFVRRMDDQVKIGGFRIELQEIEVVYGRHPSVEQAVALVRDNKLVIYLKLASGVMSSASLLSEIRTASSRSLTYYMMPKSTVVVDSFPQTANGKLDRKALPDPPTSTDDDNLGSENTTHNATTLDSHSNSNSDLILKGNGKSSDMVISSNMLNNRSQSLLAIHICDVINTVRGRRPGINSSFASIGVDSLGAIVLVRQLSDSLHGYRVSPNTLFAPGMTAYKLAGILLPKLREEKPDLIIKLGLDSEMGISDDTNGDYNKQMNDLEMGNNSNYNNHDDDEDEVNEFDDSFDIALASSRGYLEGVRGFFAFMVLWDHYSCQTNAPAWQSDVNLFIMISGVTTSLQLRTPPKYRVNPETGIKELLPRKPMNFIAFIVSRVIGIFPILWIALLLCSPSWPLASSNNGVCAFLYVIGMQCWYRPACHVSGPNVVLFASIVWNVLLIYAIFRLLFSRIQEWYMNRYPNSKLTELIYNRIENFNKMVGWTFLLVCVIVCLFVIALYFTFAKNPPVFLPYMFGGMLAANAMECFAYRVKWFPKAPDADSPIDPLEGSNWHWNVLFHTMQSIWTNGLFETFYTLPNTTITSNNVKSDEEPNEQTPFASDIHPGQYCEAEANVSTLWKYTKICSLYLWQFTPDFLTVFCGLQLSQIGTLNTDSIALAAEQLYLPLTFLALIIVGILQYGNSRFNISRFAFANPALGLMGYCSFGIYLFQQIIVNYYFPLLSGLNFYTSSVGVRTLVILIVILFAWLVQKYIVDSFSVFLYNRIMKYIVKENDNDDEGGSVGTSRRTAKVVEMQSVAN